VGCAHRFLILAATQDGEVHRGNQAGDGNDSVIPAPAGIQFLIGTTESTEHPETTVKAPACHCEEPGDEAISTGRRGETADDPEVAEERQREETIPESVRICAICG
jgi:hypothetical protein